MNLDHLSIRLQVSIVRECNSARRFWYHWFGTEANTSREEDDKVMYGRGRLPTGRYITRLSGAGHPTRRRMPPLTNGNASVQGDLWTRGSQVWITRESGNSALHFAKKKNKAKIFPKLLLWVIWREKKSRDKFSYQNYCLSVWFYRILVIQRIFLKDNYVHVSFANCMNVTTRGKDACYFTTYKTAKDKKLLLNVFKGQMI